MIYLIALLVPGLAMLLKGRPFLGLLCLVLQWTLLGWIPAALWAVFVVADAKAGERALALEKRLSSGQV